MHQDTMKRTHSYTVRLAHYVGMVVWEVLDTDNTPICICKEETLAVQIVTQMNMDVCVKTDV